MTSNHGEQSTETHRNKRRKVDDNAASTSTNQIQSITNQIRWRTSAEHQSYSSKLIAALRHVRRPNAHPIPGGRELRAAADTALAMAAKGRTRWSRAILNSRVKLRLTRRHKKAKIRAKAPPPPPRLSPSLTAEKSTATAIEKRVKVLSRLVPGCRKLSFPNLLEEATDYIAALQLQVRTMAALAEFLSGSTGSMDTEPSSVHSSST
ncbi:hypothetical protein RND81_09G244300 [Saponaria officinalis]|uniref:BHLH domain-containing protein n=1 Tax=Saponaria officinalis TaxID=3572 RepID=A0AAW1IQ06_SAPOF